MVVLHTVHDTLQFDEDTLAIWVENLNILSADLTWALRQQSAGNFPAAEATLARVTRRTDLDQQDQKDLAAMPLLMEALQGRAAHEVPTRYFRALEELTSDPHSFTGNIAKNILRNHGYYFPPIYRFPDRVKGRVGEEFGYVADQPLTAFKVFPNPSNGQFTLDWQPVEEGVTEAHLTIRDLSGRLVQERSVKAHEQQLVNLKNQPAGVYYYQLEISGQVPILGKIIIQ